MADPRVWEEKVERRGLVKEMRAAHNMGIFTEDECLSILYGTNSQVRYALDEKEEEVACERRSPHRV